MANDRLFKELCSREIMRIGWHLAQADSRDDFVTDPVGHADFASNLDERLMHVVEQVETHRYRPRHLLDIDIPKSGLSVRPGNVLPIEEASLLHAIVYLLAPLLDKRLDKSVYSYRLHPNWKEKAKKRDSLFREADVDIPFLKKKTIRAISPFEAWYELWPEFEADAAAACTDEGYTHLTKTDITAYFENIDLRLLETELRDLLKREENRLLQVLFRVLDGWTRVTSAGTPIGRGIPQGNEISSFLANVYLVPLDRELTKFCRKRDAKWFRYVDDVKVFTKSERDAREAVFVINDALRSLHLNLQGSKTQILSGDELGQELDNSEIHTVDEAYTNIRKLVPKAKGYANQVTKELKALQPLVSRFRRGVPGSVAKLGGKDNRLFRRLLTVYGHCKRPHLSKAAIAALKQLPELRILRKTLQYLAQLDSRTHGATLDALLQMLESDELPFPYQAGVVLESVANLQPSDASKTASRVRRYALTKGRHWFVVQRALEAIFVYPYRADNAQKIADKYVVGNHPLVRRAACVLLLRSPKHHVRKRLSELIYDADPEVSRLALYFLRLVQDCEFARQDIARMRHGSNSEFAFQKSLPRLYALAATEEKDIASAVLNVLRGHPVPKSDKLRGHRAALEDRLTWSQVPPAAKAEENA